jgi:ribosomal protein S18 acetylase RimI-like enzyme
MPPPLDAASRFGVSYRRFTDDDLPFVSALYASGRREELAVTGWPLELQDQFLAQQAAAQHAHYALHFADAEWLIVERGGEAIGRLYLRTLEDALHIVDISLCPGSRGLGIGGAILADILSQARGLGKLVSIHVEKNNPARSLYARLGFEIAEDRGAYDFLRAVP